MQLFEELPESMGFNIEIKYPPRTSQKNLNVRERNEMLDKILKVTFDYAKKRPLFFSVGLVYTVIYNSQSFDPEICLLLSKKQPYYTVFFLSEGRAKDRAYDKRTTNLSEAINFSHEGIYIHLKAESLTSSVGLRGIVCEAQHVIAYSDLIPELHKKGLLLFTWGDVKYDKFMKRN